MPGKGDYYNIQIPQFARPGAPRERIPIYLAGVNKYMIKAAASTADGLIGHPIYTRKYIQDKVLPALEASKVDRQVPPDALRSATLLARRGAHGIGRRNRCRFRIGCGKHVNLPCGSSTGSVAYTVAFMHGR